ncbi:hypothetical protein SARC_03297 [Sphaeroforma arctica JP610]|uniref:BHLH domain-containing protein n=1 Tax=Sphaeroforma arctica JP610 TaxID=667725 RepID=A0A0L0G651_9EUKA|nr:hypothetical protein SARC_03297 [Sphaeroforma arctica JP610]KNC84492.1 hypothetical protein SARC_03297 [Sphaeroforma arctica JP610]|eukprot:XP_014158394.1 hypothetical protein SARC_03297 [Sphaeroforma arctica JP610]
MSQMGINLPHGQNTMQQQQQQHQQTRRFQDEMPTQQQQEQYGQDYGHTNQHSQQSQHNHQQALNGFPPLEDDSLLTLGDELLNSLASCVSTPALTPMLTPAEAFHFLSSSDLNFSSDTDMNFLGASALAPLTDMQSMHLPTPGFPSTNDHLDMGMHMSKTNHKEDSTSTQNSSADMANSGERIDDEGMRMNGGSGTMIHATTNKHGTKGKEDANTCAGPTTYTSATAPTEGMFDSTAHSANLPQRQESNYVVNGTHRNVTATGTWGDAEAARNRESRATVSESVFHAPTTDYTSFGFGLLLNGAGRQPTRQQDQFAVPTSVFGAMLPPAMPIPVQGVPLAGVNQVHKAPLLQRRQSVPAPIKPAIPVSSTYKSGSHSNQTTPQLAPTPFTTPVLPHAMWGTTSPVVPPLQLPEVKSNYQAIQEGEGSSRGFVDDVLKVGNRRIHHKTSEKRRRETINMLFAQAAALVPVLTQQRAKGVSHSKTVILQHVVDHLAERTSSDAQITQLRERNHALVQENTKLKRYVGQSYNNVKFILENEPELPGLTKRWFLNRIFNQTEKARILTLLKKHKQEYVDRDIDLKEFESQTSIEYDNPLYVRMDHIRYTPPMADHHDIDRAIYRESIIDNMYQTRNRYVINNNGARNEMVSLGKKDGFRWILPFDGNCFFTMNAWAEMRNIVHHRGNETKYFYVPMERMQDNADLLDPNFWPDALEEPQLLFRNDSSEKFDEEKTRYGRRPKVDMLLRLAIPGVWDAQVLKSNPYYEEYSYEISQDIPGNDTVPPASWVARLYSGSAEQEQTTEDSASLRKYARCIGVQLICDQVAAKALEELHGFNPDDMLFYNKKALKKTRNSYKDGDLAENVAEQLRTCAEDAYLKDAESLLAISPEGPIYTSVEYGVRDHTEPEVAAPGRLAPFFRSVTCLGLAGYVLGEKRYIERASQLVNNFFDQGRDNSVSVDTMINNIYPKKKEEIEELHNIEKAILGVYEFKDWYYVLDIVRLLNSEKALTATDMVAARDWMSEYFEKVQAIAKPRVPVWGFEMASAAARGVWYDVQMASIAHFVGNSKDFLVIIDSGKARMQRQFSNTGAQGDWEGEFIGTIATARAELETTSNRIMRQLTESGYVLSGWVAMCQMATTANVDLWNYKHKMGLNGPLLRGALTVYLPFYSDKTELPSTHGVAERQEFQDKLKLKLRSTYNNLNTSKPEGLWTEDLLVAIYHMTRDQYNDLEASKKVVSKVHHYNEAVTMPVENTGLIRPFWNLAL